MDPGRNFGVNVVGLEAQSKSSVADVGQERLVQSPKDAIIGTLSSLIEKPGVFLELEKRAAEIPQPRNLQRARPDNDPDHSNEDLSSLLLDRPLDLAAMITV